jgi:hypothetical protein
VRRPKLKVPDTSCCPAPLARELPGYKLCAYVDDWIDTKAGPVPKITGKLSLQDITGRWAMRWGLGRNHYTVVPGLYAIGNANAESPVLVSANYKLSFDILRREVANLDVWVLVIDTKGINVWCAAGKGTFGTDEITNRVIATQLNEIVSHKELIVPQLGAPGIAAHEVKKGCGFKVTYGPVRAEDLPAFLSAGKQATTEMRRVTFTTLERFILTPVEITILWKKILWAMLALFLLGGIGPDIFSLKTAWSRGGNAIIVGLSGVIAGAVITPTLLPWLPGKAFALKGAVTGAAVSLLGLIGFSGQLGFGNSLAALLALTAVSSFIAMNFTGSSTYTSPTGVEKEMRQAIPFQLAALLVAGVAFIWAGF